MGVRYQEVTVLPDGRIDARGAAAFLGLTVKTLSAHRSRGTGPRFIKRGRIYYHIEELQRWVNEGESQKTTPRALQR